MGVAPRPRRHSGAAAHVRAQLQRSRRAAPQHARLRACPAQLWRRSVSPPAQERANSARLRSDGQVPPAQPRCRLKGAAHKARCATRTWKAHTREAAAAGGDVLQRPQCGSQHAACGCGDAADGGACACDGRAHAGGRARGLCARERARRYKKAGTVQRRGASRALRALTHTLPYPSCVMATPAQRPRGASSGKWMQLATLLKAKAAAFLCKLMEQVKLLLQALGDTRAEIRSILHPTQEGERDTASKPKVLDAQVRGCLFRTQRSEALECARARECTTARACAAEPLRPPPKRGPPHRRRLTATCFRTRRAPLRADATRHAAQAATIMSAATGMPPDFFGGSPLMRAAARQLATDIS